MFCSTLGSKFTHLRSFVALQVHGWKSVFVSPYFRFSFKVFHSNYKQFFLLLICFLFKSTNQMASINFIIRPMWNNDECLAIVCYNLKKHLIRWDLDSVFCVAMKLSLLFLSFIYRVVYTMDAKLLFSFSCVPLNFSGIFFLCFKKRVINWS